MGEEPRLVRRTASSQARALALPAQSFELVHRPSNEVLVDAPCEGVQLGAVEGPVIADPAPHLRVDLLGETGQIRPAATPEVPGPDLLSYRLPRLGADGRSEAHKEASPAPRQSSPEGIAEEIEAGVLRVPRRFASLQYTIFVFSGCSSRPRAPSRSAMEASRRRA